MITAFIGYDIRDHKAFRVCESSLQAKASEPVRVIPLIEHECRKKHGFARPYKVEPNGQMFDGIDGKPFSTQFSYTRFLVPHIAGYVDDLTVFCDADMLWRDDVYELIRFCEDDKKRAVWCVQHEHVPTEEMKMDGVIQAKYRRKNWSSLVVWNPSRNVELTPQIVSTADGSFLHQFAWLENDDIGHLPEFWNWLEGTSDSRVQPSVVHFTRGTPDFEGYENVPYADEWRKAWRNRIPSELERTGWS